MCCSVGYQTCCARHLAPGAVVGDASKHVLLVDLCADIDTPLSLFLSRARVALG